MDMNSDWKKKVGFPINYDSGQSSDDELVGCDADEAVVFRRRESARLLADRGDGAAADLLGTTPPRTLQRHKERHRKIRSGFIDSVQMRHNRRSVDDVALSEISSQDRERKRQSHRLRAKERHFKGHGRADSLPAAPPAVPALVESCNRFMCLSSRLKNREALPPLSPAAPSAAAVPPAAPRETPQAAGGEGGAASRESFYQTFSILINMGNIEKGCRRTMSREEQVWQSELKDMIWLELQARVGGRTLAQQDALLCARRKDVPRLLAHIRDYRFVNPEPCRSTSRLYPVDGTKEGPLAEEENFNAGDQGGAFGCLSLECSACASAVGLALREVGALLDAFHRAGALYPSSTAMTQDHPMLAAQVFQDRLKAMCLWYNTALHMRLKLLAIRRMIRTMRLKVQRRQLSHLPSTDSDRSRQSSESRPCQVRFDVSNEVTPTDSNNSESSAHSDAKDHSQGNDKSQGNDDHDGQNDTDNEKHAEEENDEALNTETNDGSIKQGLKNLKLDVKGTLDKERRDVTDDNGQATPEIVISEGHSQYGPTDTQSSSESGYSTAVEDCGDVYQLGGLEDLAGLKLLDKCAVSPLRVHHQEMLKTMGVRRMMMFINKLRANLLGKVHHTLEKPQSVGMGMGTEQPSEEAPVEVFADAREDTRDEEEDKATESADSDAQRALELRRYGCWSAECLAMALPSYRSHFLLLSSIGMEAVHDYLSLRLEDTPKEPSCLTAKQLLHEMKEGLDIATEMRASFAGHIEGALRGLRGGAPARGDLLRIVRTFDATIETVLKQYLSYLRTMSATEHMGRGCLQAEWAFAARLAKRIAAAAALAPRTFAEIACTQLDRVLHQFENKFKQLAETTEKMPDPDRHIVYALCREAQSLYASERDATLQCAQWARALAARLRRAKHHAYKQQRADILEAMMRVRDCIVEHAKFIADKTKEAGARDPDAALPRVRELLLQLYKLGFELHQELYKLAVVPTLAPGAGLGLRQPRPASLQPPRARPAPPTKRPDTVILRDDFHPLIHKELHRFVNEGPRPPRAPPAPPSRQWSVTSQAPRPLPPARLLRAESINEEGEGNVFDDKLFDNINSFGGQTQTSIELLLSGEQEHGVHASEQEAAMEAPEERASEQERQWAARVARAVVEFARCWMAFVVERCDQGRGLRPRWASQGLEFLMLACEPCNTQHLSDSEFEELKQAMDGCISHVVGRRPLADAPLCAGAVAPAPSDTQRRRRPSPKPVHFGPGGQGGHGGSAPPTPSSPCDPDPQDPDPLLSCKELDTSEHTLRVVSAVRRLEVARDERLRGQRALGRVLACAAPSYEPRLRQVHFKWQRGLKIGAGTFGKVYTVVNTESGQLLAMKELAVGAGDRRALQRAANELHVLEGVLHPHLVRYYGCELHREEMLIFMELCVEGSLEALVGAAGALGEGMVRRYTKQLVSAVLALHSRSIAHRDIKSGNIFLTNEGHCLKLGDFGCAVKIRATATAAGELQGCVGTQAYMAPEVFMKSSGHGRAADIWSLGCVVTEMASGKRPFPEYDSNYQIMFVVGMGGRPAIPPTLSEEGQRFALACLTHDPDQRPRAHDLQAHHFLMIKSDEDCKCGPGFLIS